MKKHLNRSLILLVGKSGSGKTTLAYACRNKTKDNIKILESYTTRPKRFDWEEGHIFITEDEYHALPNKVANTYYRGNYYCATEEQVKENDIYVIDMNGINSFKSNYKGDKTFKIIYLDVPWYKRFYRMVLRGDKLLEVIKRLLNDHKAFKSAKEQADIILKNVGLNEGVFKILKLLDV